ncbi:hypothetical protein ACFUCV_03235 [Specibacter sp. NPDC057265]|uniref:hypothetical protein n=1 Tax=Specibacter sp. NPDC057265 TaxID=3346075 RepID=UPI00363A20D9
MSIDRSPSFFNESAESSATTISCTTCNSAEKLIIESLDFAGPKLLGRLALSYSCGNCLTPYVHESTPVDVARFLANQPDPAPVAHLGGHYIHCGEPMAEGALQLTAMKVDDDDLASAPAVEVESTVLRCQCGFQMAVPAISLN